MDHRRRRRLSARSPIAALLIAAGSLMLLSAARGDPTPAPDQGPPPAASETPAPAPTPDAPADNISKPAPKDAPKDKAPAPPENLEPIPTDEVFSILGKGVRGPAGEDMGRVVDLLFDRDAHPRSVVIDFGGFLGVGSRRIAIDWNLLRFEPTNLTAPLQLSLGKADIQAAPEYKDTAKPPTMVGPPPAPPAETAAPPPAPVDASPTPTPRPTDTGQTPAPSDAGR
jgi:hypothetical protein